MPAEENDLDALGKALLVQLVQCISGMTGVDMGAVGTISSDVEQKFTEPLATIIDFTGTKTGNLMVSTDEKTLASILSMDDLPAIHERKAERAEYEGLFAEAMNTAAGECLSLLQVGENSLVTMYAPKILYGTLRFPNVVLKTFALETHFGIFHATVSVDAMQPEFLRLTDELLATKRDLQAALINSEELREQADIANRMKSEFLANMSHEIRTPLNGVLGLAESLAEIEDRPEQKADLDTIVDSGKSLLAILNDILDYSKMEAGFINLEVRDFDPVQTLHDVASLFERQASSKGIDFSLDLPDEGSHCLVRGDGTRLQQILCNLLSNALKFTREGTVTIQFRQEALADDLVRMSFQVSDSGVGIEAEALSHIFERFTQADGSTTRKFGGTGLGLAITQGLVELMGGEISAESVPGRGTTFTIDLTMGRGQASPDVAAELQTDRMHEKVDGLRVLVVDDNTVNQTVARRILERWNCRVDTADDGREALEFVKRVRFDVVLMDCMMPVLDGYGATRAIRKLPSPTCDVPIIALTANAMAEDHDLCFEAGMGGVVTKPISKDDLLISLINVMGDSGDPSE
ncbi:MAG: response regulator [Myxococcales bacterium]|nr:response regulator [Myxococcales bacterium]